MPHPDPEHLDPEHLALVALPAEPVDPVARTHLQDCELCRHEVMIHRRTVELALWEGDDAVEPPPRVWRRIVEELADEGGRVGRGSVTAPPARRAWRRAVMPLVAAVAGVVVGFALPWQERAAAEIVVELRPVSAAASTATGVVEFAHGDGTRELRLRVDGVPAAERADYLEAWLIDGTGTRVCRSGPWCRMETASPGTSGCLPTCPSPSSAPSTSPPSGGTAIPATRDTASCAAPSREPRARGV